MKLNNDKLNDLTTYIAITKNLLTLNQGNMQFKEVLSSLVYGGKMCDSKVVDAFITDTVFETNADLLPQVICASEFFFTSFLLI